MVTSPINFYEIAFHLIPFPRLKFLSPFLKGQSLVQFTKLKVNQATNHSIFGGVWFDAPLPATYDVFTKSVAQNLETDEVEGVYFTFPYPIWQLAGDPQNTCALLNHALSAL